jgi:hypothetical protein
VQLLTCKDKALSWGVKVSIVSDYGIIFCDFGLQSLGRELVSSCRVVECISIQMKRQD